MKKLIQSLGLLTLILTIFVSCKKENTVKPGDEKYAISFNVTSPERGVEKGILVGSKAELEAIVKGESNGIKVSRLAKTNNVFGVITKDPVTPYDPSEECWSEITNYKDAHIEEWLQIANSTCKPYMTCITCPQSNFGLFVLYVIKPTSIKCVESASAVMTRFNFDRTQYDTREVSDYIKNFKG